MFILLIRNPNLHIESVDDEIYLFDIRDDKVIDLNEIAAAVWNSIEGSNIDQIVQQLSVEYDVDEVQLRNDVISFIEQGQALGIFIEEEKFYE